MKNSRSFLAMLIYAPHVRLVEKHCFTLFFGNFENMYALGTTKQCETVWGITKKECGA